MANKRIDEEEYEPPMDYVITEAESPGYSQLLRGAKDSADAAIDKTKSLINQHKSQTALKDATKEALQEADEVIEELEHWFHSHKLHIPKMGRGVFDKITSWIGRKSEEGHLANQEKRVEELAHKNAYIRHLRSVKEAYMKEDKTLKNMSKPGYTAVEKDTTYKPTYKPAPYRQRPLMGKGDFSQFNQHGTPSGYAHCYDFDEFNQHTGRGYSLQHMHERGHGVSPDMRHKYGGYGISADKMNEIMHDVDHLTHGVTELMHTEKIMGSGKSIKDKLMHARHILQTRLDMMEKRQHHGRGVGVSQALNRRFAHPHGDTEVDALHLGAEMIGHELAEIKANKAEMYDSTYRDQMLRFGPTAITALNEMAAVLLSDTPYGGGMHGGAKPADYFAGIDALSSLIGAIGNQVDQGRRTTAEIMAMEHKQKLADYRQKLVDEGKISPKAASNLAKKGRGMDHMFGGNAAMAAAAAGDVIGKLTESVGNQVDQGRRTTAELNEMNGVADTQRLQEQANRTRLLQREFDKLQNERFWGFDTFTPRRLRLRNFGFTDKWQVQDPKYAHNLSQADDALEEYIMGYLAGKGSYMKLHRDDHNKKHVFKGHGSHWYMNMDTGQMDQHAVQHLYPNPDMTYQ